MKYIERTTFLFLIDPLHCPAQAHKVFPSLHSYGPPPDDVRSSKAGVSLYPYQLFASKGCQPLKYAQKYIAAAKIAGHGAFLHQLPDMVTYAVGDIQL